MRKTLKFTPNLVPLILEGTKKNTFRLFDDKDLQVGDFVDFVNSDTRETFTSAELTSVEEKTFAELKDADWSGHEKYANDEEMYRTFSEMYQQPITPATPLKVVWFELTP